jgi:hypothetical protein
MGENVELDKTISDPDFGGWLKPVDVLDNTTIAYVWVVPVAILLNIFKRKQSVIMNHSRQGFEGALMVKIQGRGSIHA